MILLGLDGVGKQILFGHHSRSQPQMETRKLSFQINDNLCVCVCEREREREMYEHLKYWIASLHLRPLNKNPYTTIIFVVLENQIQNLESKQIIVRLSSTLILQMQPPSEWSNQVSFTWTITIREIGLMNEQVDLITTPSNKFHQMAQKVKYCKRGLVTRHGHVTWN